MDQILECKKPVILVNMTGSAMNLSVAEEKQQQLFRHGIQVPEVEKLFPMLFWREITFWKTACNIL